jgi:IS66 C-terminal element
MAKLNGLNPETYLKDILANVAEGHTINRIDDLVSWRMIPDDPTLIDISRSVPITTKRTPSVATEGVRSRCRLASGPRPSKVDHHVKPRILTRLTSRLGLAGIVDEIAHPAPTGSR